MELNRLAGQLLTIVNETPTTWTEFEQNFNKIRGEKLEKIRAENAMTNS